MHQVKTILPDLSCILICMNFTTIFYDLDDTLYPPTTGIWEVIVQRMQQFMEEQVGIPQNEVMERRKYYFQTYGTTMRGLYFEKGIDIHAYLDYVHQIPIREYLQPDPKLREVLLRYPQKRWILTNSDRRHAAQVLSALKVEDLFEGVIDILDMFPNCKPEHSVFTCAMQRAGESNPQSCILVDDNPNNINAAREFGFYTVRPLIRNDHAQPDISIASIHELGQALDSILQIKK